MLTPAARFRLNEGTATGKIIEGEALLINVVTGRYYSLADAGCVAWVHLSSGGSLEEAVAAIVDRYDVDAGAVSDDVRALVEELLAEELLVEAGSSHAVDAPDEDSLPPRGATRRRYTGVELLTFRDMEDLLAFDPPLPRVPERPTRSSEA